jgi:hypothetical protein
LAGSVEVLTNCSRGKQPPLTPFGLESVAFGLRRVGDTEERLLPTFDVLFRNQVVEANQFTFCALVPFTS